MLTNPFWFSLAVPSPFPKKDRPQDQALPPLPGAAQGSGAALAARPADARDLKSLLQDVFSGETMDQQHLEVKAAGGYKFTSNSPPGSRQAGCLRQSRSLLSPFVWRLLLASLQCDGAQRPHVNYR